MKISRELKLGAFVISVLVISFFVINWLRGKDIFNREIELVSHYKDVETLVVSNPVYIRGYKAGTVNEIVYNPETDMFDVTCSVLKQFRIPVDSKMTIYSVDIMGGKGVKIEPGESDVLVADGAELQPSSIPDMIGSLGDNLVPLIAKVENTLDSLTTTVSSVNALLGETNQNHLTGILSRLEKTMSNLQGLSNSINGKSEDIENIISNFSSLSVKLDQVMAKADTTLEGINTIETNISDDLTGAVSSLKKLLENINDPDGTVGKLMSDGGAYSSLESLLSDVDNLVQKISANPKKFLKISVF